jgi:hypothetical protein
MGARVLDLLGDCGYIFWACDGDDGDGDDAVEACGKLVK